ncbi:MAG: hypothetical protein ACRC1Z_05150 [Waterburya sp.]
MKLTKPINQNLALVPNNRGMESLAVVVFSHHRDLKVALDELRDAGFSDDWMTVMARDVQRCSWCSELITKNYFDAEKFDFSQMAQDFFLKLFRRGKYLVLISGNEQDVDAASKIMSRRQNHAQVWQFG